jgi:SAM-dependent methyltransferase
MGAAGAALPEALARTLPLLAPGARPAQPDVRHGYLDLLGEAGAGDDPPSPAQRLMLTRALPAIYERWWRPAWGRLLKGALGGGMRDEHRIARLLLGLTPGDGVLDVGCGPGNFTREFAAEAPDGLVVGLDASKTMLARAVAEPGGPNLAYVRGDASALPFRDATFQGVCCFAALYLIEDPGRAIGEIVRVLAPGGRVALLSSCNRGPLPATLTNAVVRTASGVRVFGRDDLTRALREHGLTRVAQRVSGWAQFVSGRKPGG